MSNYGINRLCGGVTLLEKVVMDLQPQQNRLSSVHILLFVTQEKSSGPARSR
jgi:hypothetical protein